MLHSNFDHPEEPYFFGHNTNPRKQQRPSFSGTGSGAHGTPHQRPSSSAEVGSPYNFFPSHDTSGSSGGSGAPGRMGRPISALGYGYNDPSPYLHLGRNLPTPNGQITTSVKSVFDCDLGCFVDKVISEEVTEAQIITTTTITKPTDDENMLVTDVLMTETSVTKSHTEQIQHPIQHGTKQPSKAPNDDSENLLVPLVGNALSAQDTLCSQTSDLKEV